MVNCAHPDHFGSALLNDEGWEHRVRGIRANASRRSHAELDHAKGLDTGNLGEFARQCQDLRSRLLNLTKLSGYCALIIHISSSIAPLSYVVNSNMTRHT
jgi:S-methylmethionine-dependent homocysteine/selenocysteine methylase